MQVLSTSKRAGRSSSPPRHRQTTARNDATLKTLTCLSAKGGTGKTTLASNLASVAEHHGFTTALLDMDPQGSLSAWARVREQDTPVVALLLPRYETAAASHAPPRNAPARTGGGAIARASETRLPRSVASHPKTPFHAATAVDRCNRGEAATCPDANSRSLALSFESLTNFLKQLDSLLLSRLG